MWQTGSGTQSNMNMNEVLANRARELLGGERGAKAPRAPQRRREPRPVVERRLPDRDARRRASRRVEHALLPALQRAARHARARRRRRSPDIVKIGRTHLQDATPLTLGQEFSATSRSSTTASRHIEAALAGTCCELALGGTAVGTGLNAHPEFARARRRRARATDRAAVRHRAEQVRGARRATMRWSHAHGALKTLAAALMKIANDVRWLASRAALRARRDHDPGERAGQLDHAGQGEPDAVRGADDGVRAGDRATTSRSTSAAQAGNFELNVFKPA